MGNIFYPQFYLTYGIRNIDRLSNPRAFNIEDFHLPKNAIVHYLPMHAADLGPDETFFPLVNERMPPYADVVTEMATTYGNPRRKGAFNMENLKQKWIRSRRGFRRITDMARALDNQNSTIVANYALIPMQWRYLPLPMARFYRFQNMLSTLYTRAKYYAEHSARQQFIFVQIPDEVPTRQHLNVSVESALPVPLTNAYRAQHQGTQPSQTYADTLELYLPGISADLPRDVATEAFDESALGFESNSGYLDAPAVALEEMNRIRLGFFHNDDALFIQDLWQWMSDNRSESLLSIVPEEHLDKINLVFLRMGKFTVLNLGYLNKWTKSETNQKGMGFSTVSRHLLQHITSLKLLTGIADQAIVEETLPDENGDSEVISVSVPDAERIDPPAPAPVSAPMEADAPAVVAPLPVQNAVTETTPSGLRTQLVNALKTVGNASTPVPSVTRLVEAPNVDAEFDIEPREPEIVDDPLVKGVKSKAESLLSRGLITQGEYRRHVRLAESYKTLPSPFNDEETLEQFSRIPMDIVWDFKPAEVPDIPHVSDKSMLKSTLIDFDQKYVKEVMQRDVVNFVLNLQKAGIAVTDFKVERQTDALNDLYDYTLKLSPVQGSPSTVRFQLPVIDKNGKYRVGGIKYYMRKLRYDKPIRKISPSTVALSTYYGKLFVDRSDKRRSNYEEWLIDALNAASLATPASVTEIVYGNTFADSQPVPRTYSALAKHVISFESAGIQFVFDYANLAKNFPEYQGQTNIPVGKKRGKTVTMDSQGYLTVGPEQLGHIAKLFGADPNQRPNELATISILGEEFPLAILIMYLMKGLNAMVDSMEIKPERRMKGARVNPDPNSFELVFADEIWRIPRVPHPDVLIYTSLLLWKNALKNFSVVELDEPDNYNALLADMSLSGRYLYEFGNLQALFIDPVAEENLKAMGEPTEFLPLLHKAAQYLVTDEYPSDLSSEGSLFKGYERMTGAVYRALIDGVRRYSSQPMGGRATVDIPPFLILSEIQSDPSVALVEDSNPIHNLKEKENVTYSGTGGRSKRSMVRRTRAFHPSDIGIRSEAGVDNGDVGINCFLTANPNLTSLRGTAQTETDLNPERGVANLLSTSALISPFSTYDDPKRVKVCAF